MLEFVEDMSNATFRGGGRGGGGGRGEGERDDTTIISGIVVPGSVA